MAENIFDIIFHPVRLKIIRALTIYNELTSMQLFKEIGDVPQATLYRHIQTLLEKDVLCVIREHRVRGNTESVYALNINKVSLTATDLQNISKDEKLLYFLNFLMMNQAEYENYLKYIENKSDQATYAMAHLYLSDQELNDLQTEINEIIKSRIKNEPSEDRKLRIISTIIIPEKIEKKL
ncbi:helix-turn-helix domain-containing protein [Caldalkalibacillus mannanilyticus]|uniref:helix-turn-helix domain-containing protein n=1 Tax=Caldalkalibacillus mannanilyticus TaxID=1418 RepID=UPI00046951B4|nr:helix-turn-helix domain-containing protein [Caldalkalibacillus mannanilyticus]